MVAKKSHSQGRVFVQLSTPAKDAKIIQVTRCAKPRRQFKDLRCSADDGHPAHQLCDHCEVPICTECYEHLLAKQLPPLSLANDMWTGFAPERIYKEKATVMELICASPCITTLVCMSMEARFRHEASTAPLNEVAHMSRHRFGARGNALTFPLPWEEVLAALQEACGEAGPNQEGSVAAAPVLPRSGKQLAEVARVILKTNKEGRTTEEEIKSLIHQANVRRQAPSSLFKLIGDLHRIARHAKDRKRGLKMKSVTCA